MKIRNTHDVKMAYETIRMLQTITPLPAQYIAGLKKDIRAFNRRQEEENRERRIVESEGIDGFTELIRFPEQIQTEEEAEVYFRNNEYRECAPSAYDCTGQAFTAWYKIFARRGRMMAYHCIRFDV